MLKPPEILRKLSGRCSRSEQRNRLVYNQRNYYTLTLKTGDFRGAGTMENIWVNLSGACGQSGVQTLPFLSKSDSHDRAAFETYELDTNSTAIGPLSLVKVGLTDIKDYTEGWYLEEVTIKDHINKLIYYCPCNKWLGRSTSFGADFPTEVTLLPSTVPSSTPAHIIPAPISVRIAANAIPARFKVMHESTRAQISSSFGFAGEDAVFSKQVGRYMYIGIADGVYDWKFKGVNPGIWSQKLLENVMSFCSNGESEEPIELLKRAYQKNLLDGIEGSSTVCIIRIDLETGELISTNVGDSGYLIVEETKGTRPVIRYRSIEKEHHMGCPLQLGSHNDSTNPLDDAETNVTQLHPGEFLVIATDGVFDNVLGKDILSIVGQKDSAVMSKCCSILKKCYDNVSDKSSDTPFSRAASSEMNMIFSGGKDDDMSCFVVQVAPPIAK